VLSLRRLPFQFLEELLFTACTHPLLGRPRSKAKYSLPTPLPVARVPSYDPFPLVPPPLLLIEETVEERFFSCWSPFSSPSKETHVKATPPPAVFQFLTLPLPPFFFLDRCPNTDCPCSTFSTPFGAHVRFSFFHVFVSFSSRKPSGVPLFPCQRRAICLPDHIPIVDSWHSSWLSSTSPIGA